MCELCEKHPDVNFESRFLLAEIIKHSKEKIQAESDKHKKQEEKPMIEFVQSKEGDLKKVELELVYDSDGANLRIKGGPYICVLRHNGVLQLYSDLPDYIGFKLTANNRIVAIDEIGYLDAEKDND